VADQRPPPDPQTVGEVKGGRYQYAMEHLSCFTGAMLGLGAQVLDYRKKDLFNAKRITQTCYYIGCALSDPLPPIERS
jgi:mannosyl-oligosaccharide alpha-1,2-mannosidase